MVCLEDYNYICSLFAGYHSWLLSPAVDILPALLLPLAGPEQFSDEEMEALPLDLQYLTDDKERESDPDIRKMLVESIMKVDINTFNFSLCHKNKLSCRLLL